MCTVSAAFFLPNLYQKFHESIQRCNLIDATWTIMKTSRRQHLCRSWTCLSNLLPSMNILLDFGNILNISLNMVNLISLMMLPCWIYTSGRKIKGRSIYIKKRLRMQKRVYLNGFLGKSSNLLFYIYIKQAAVEAKLIWIVWQNIQRPFGRTITHGDEKDWKPHSCKADKCGHNEHQMSYRCGRNRRNSITTFAASVISQDVVSLILTQHHVTSSIMVCK